jgi:hypothetical protein
MKIAARLRSCYPPLPLRFLGIDYTSPPSSSSAHEHDRLLGIALPSTRFLSGYLAAAGDPTVDGHPLHPASVGTFGVRHAADDTTSSFGFTEAPRIRSVYRRPARGQRGVRASASASFRPSTRGRPSAQGTMPRAAC